MTSKTPKLVYLVIGAIGVIGQALWLRHELVDSYPYKVMGPLALVYSSIGEWGVFVAPAMAILVTVILLWNKPKWLTIGAVVACPLMFWLLFEVFFWLSGVSTAEMKVHQYDDVSGESVRLLFIELVLTLAGVGLLVGWLSTRFVDLVSRRMIVLLSGERFARARQTKVRRTN